jgi:hypothetical protein
MTELCFCLWYYLDDKQNIVAISAKAHLLEGTDEEKSSALLTRSDEFTSVPRREVAPVHFSALSQIGVEDFFAPEFDRIQSAIGHGTAIPEEKLFFATPLFDFGHGFVPVEIGTGFIRERPDPWFEQQINALISVYVRHPNHGSHGADAIRDLRRIGELLHEKGGMKLMRAAHSEFSRRCTERKIRDTSGDISAPRSLEHRWDGIGAWQG